MKKQYNAYVIKQMVNAIACTIGLWMHLGGFLSTQEARVALGCRLVRLLTIGLCFSVHYRVLYNNPSCSRILIGSRL